MTRLNNEVLIEATPEKVWQVLTDLESLEQYDPVVNKSVTISALRTGLGAERQCDVNPKGWFKERVTQWEPHRALAFELFECTLPIKSLRHSYTIVNVNGATRVRQVMEYQMKFGIFGSLMDLLMVRKKWDDGIKKFFMGLKQYIEAPAK